jgi:hypothetical protein
VNPNTVPDPFFGFRGRGPARPIPKIGSGTVFALLIAVALAGERNLVPNGSFDEGAAGATKVPGWTEVDGLTTFFVDEPGRGRVLEIDTDVNLSEANARWEEMALPASERPKAKPKGPTRPPKYDTVGGTTGAKIYSDHLRVEPGMRYRLRVDVKTDAPTVMIFVKGYARFQGGFRKFYQCYKNIVKPEPGWHTYERTFNPTAKSPKVTHIRVMPYAYWPPGRAWVDRVEITRIGKEKPAGAATPKSILVNGDFEAKGLDPWTTEGSAGRTVRGAEGACGRVDAGGALVSGRTEVETDRSYVLRARVLPAGGVPKAVVEGLVRFGGKWMALYTKEATVPPAEDGWVELETRFHPTADTPQVSHVRVRFTVVGEKGSLFVDDVAVEPVEAKDD